MEFFDIIGKKAMIVYNVTADKTEKLKKETKIKLKIKELRNQVDDLYKEIGKKVYEKHIINKPIDLKKELEEECTKIDILSHQIDANLKNCLDLQNKKQCHNCATQFDKDYKFCPECGEAQLKD